MFVVMLETRGDFTIETVMYRLYTQDRVAAPGETCILEQVSPT